MPRSSLSSGLIRFFILILFAGQINTARLANAYDPPAGIPVPPFGIDETVESIYGSAGYYTYYVDNTHPAATDSGNPKGSPDQPRISIPSSLAAGDVVQIRGGPYTPAGDRFYFYGQGTQSQPIIITAAGASSKPVFTKKVHFPDAQWTILENIKVQSTVGGIELRPLSNGVEIHHVSVRNCEIAGSGTFKSGQSFAASNNYYDTPLHNVIFYNNISHAAGDWQAETEDDTCCFSVQHKCNHIWILNNTGYRSGGDGVILAHGANFNTDHVYIGGNTFYQNRENGVDLKQANDVVVSENIIYSHRPVSSSSGEGIVVHYDPERIWILNNLIYDCELGIVTTGSTETYIMGNVIHNIHHTGQSYDPGSAYSMGAAIHSRNSAVQIVGNTIDDYDTGIQIGSSGPVVINNNIFSNRKEEQGYEIIHLPNPATYGSHMDYNLFHPVINGTRIAWRGNTALSLTEFIDTYSPDGTHCLDGSNPLYGDNNSHPYLIGSDSPAVNKGVLHPGYTAFSEAYAGYSNNSIAIDRRRTNRPQDGAWDIGAYEYSTGAGDNTRPKAPSSLRVR
jgi:hypothetical protein